MVRLRIATEGVPGDPMELVSGVNTVGRSAANKFVVPHATVSGFHCVITVGEQGVLVKDLNSTNGTFIDGEPVQEGILRPRQTLQLGEVALVCEVEDAGEPPLAEAPDVQETEAPTMVVAEASPEKPCRYHPQVHAEFVCSQCQALLCSGCVSVRRGDGKTWRFCPTCKGKCLPIGEQEALKAAARTAGSRTFFQRLPGAFSYPFARGGALFLAIGAVVYAFLDFARLVVRFAGGLGWVAWMIVTVFSLGYMYSYIQRVINSTANGEDNPPGLPEISDWGTDIGRPCLMFVVLFVVCFGAPVIYGNVVDEPIGLLYWSLLVLGFLYFPMALVAVAISDDFISLNPFVVLPAISRTLGHYLVTSALFFALVAAQRVSETVLKAVLPIPIVPAVLSGFVMFYFVTVEMRILGLMYFMNRQRIGWYS